jgi:hypothetical protein
MKRTLLTAASLLACGLLAATAVAPDVTAQGQNQTQNKAGAQAPAGPTFMHVQVSRVKPDLSAEWSEFMKSETLPALQKAGVKTRDVWVSAVFGEYYEFVTVTPIDSFAQYDGPNPIARALGQDGARAYAAKLSRMVTSRHGYVLQARPDLSVMGKGDEPPKLGVVSWIRIAPGRTTEFENFVKNEVLPVVRKAELKGYYVSQVMLGGNANEYVALALDENFADIGKGDPFVRVLGPDGAAKFRQKIAGLVVNVERSVYRYVPDLSRTQPTQKAANQ